MARTHSLNGIEVSAREDGTDVVLDVVIGDDTCVHPLAALRMARALKLGALAVDLGKLRVRARLRAPSPEAERESAHYLASVAAAVRSTFARPVRAVAAVECFGFWSS